MSALVLSGGFLVMVWWFGANLATAALILLIGQPELELRHRQPEYVGRHRTDIQPEPAFDWQADFEARIAAAIAEKKALTAALKEPTQEMFVPDWDSDEGPYVHSAGAGRYAHLRTEEMDAKALRDQKLADKGLALRSPWMTPVVEDVWADEMASVT